MRAGHPPLLVATRSAHKLAEIRTILGDTLPLVSLADANVPPTPEEEAIEAFATFRDNALAKARYFSGLTARPTLADDSGLVVHALAGAPGVHSRRFSGRSDLDATALDRANNAHLLERLAAVPPARRTAHYVCAAVVTTPSGRTCAALGTCAGRILDTPRGDGGFGYDPLFLVDELGLTFAQLTQEQKNQRSHRARAFRALAPVLFDLSIRPA